MQIEVLADPDAVAGQAAALIAKEARTAAAERRRFEPWRRCIDTFLAPPEDACPLEDSPIVRSTTYRVHPRSLVILFAKTRPDGVQSTTARGDQP
jgi:hypothetical protein